MRERKESLLRKQSLECVRLFARVAVLLLPKKLQNVDLVEVSGGSRLSARIILAH